MSREQIHEKIDELLGLMGIQNDRLSLRTEKISQLDIDVLRKQCIELYDQVNQLALMGKLNHSTQPSAPSVTPQKPAETSPKFKPEIEQPVEEVSIKEPKLTVEPEEVKIPPAKPKASSKEEEEMLSLFEKFNSKPIASIPRAISVAKRFEFQSEFFDGDASSYKDFMSRLDNADDREEAFAIYHEAKERLAWENEDLKDELKVLMYRKHQV